METRTRITLTTAIIVSLSCTRTGHVKTNCTGEMRRWSSIKRFDTLQWILPISVSRCMRTVGLVRSTLFGFYGRRLTYTKASPKGWLKGSVPIIGSPVSRYVIENIVFNWPGPVPMGFCRREVPFSRSDSFALRADIAVMWLNWSSNLRTRGFHPVSPIAFLASALKHRDNMYARSSTTV